MSGLRFDWETVTHTPVAAVIGTNQRRMDDGSLFWDALAFVLSESAIILTVNDDTDEIVVAHDAIPDGREWTSIPSFDDVVGKPLGWCWVSTNYRGYRDSFTLAFGDVVPDAAQPRLTFLGEGSSVTCFDLSPRSG